MDGLMTLAVDIKKPHPKAAAHAVLALVRAWVERNPGVPWAAIVSEAEDVLTVELKAARQ